MDIFNQSVVIVKKRSLIYQGKFIPLLSLPPTPVSYKGWHPDVVFSNPRTKTYQSGVIIRDTIGPFITNLSARTLWSEKTIGKANWSEKTIGKTTWTSPNPADPGEKRE